MKRMRNRRTILGYGLGAIITCPLFASSQESKFEEASRSLDLATASGQVRGAVIYVRDSKTVFTRPFGDAKSVDVAFLLGSISKPIVIAALMTLYEKGLFALEDPVKKFIPQFETGGRDRVTIKHLLTHTSGLPDQLPQNAQLRQSHASLNEFVEGTFQVPLGFEPGTRYEYSSMGIMLAAEIAQRLSGVEIKKFVAQSILEPLGMKHSALGMGDFQNGQTIPCQVEYAAVESGGGDPNSKLWDWNSKYWRELGSPWGGVQASAPDVARFLEAFMESSHSIFKRETAQLLIQNHNPPSLESRGLGFDSEMSASCSECSPKTFGHTGSTGTIAWADPVRERVCVVLTTLPARAITPHPRQLVSDCISKLPV